MVKRNEIVDYATYEDTRDGFRAEVMKAKAVRRIHLGDYLTLLFENRLPEPTTVHWHGIEVPIEMDGVPAISQPLVGECKAIVSREQPQRRRGIG